MYRVLVQKGLYDTTVHLHNAETTEEHRVALFKFCIHVLSSRPTENPLGTHLCAARTR